MIWRRPKYTGPERRRSPRWRPRPIRVLLSLLVLAAIGYAIVVLWLIGEETRIVTHVSRAVPDARRDFPYELVEIPRDAGSRQFAWAMRRGGSDEGPWALFLHGNAATVASAASISRYRVLCAAGLNVLAPEYRGFAGLDGTATEASLRADAHAAYDYLVRTRRVAGSRVIVYGWSLGAAVAADVASDTAPGGVVLEAAPASIFDMTRDRYPFFPVRLLTRRQFETISTIGRVRAPLLFLHSPDDMVVPISEGRRLFQAALAEKEFVEVRGGHFDATDVDAPAVAAALTAFLARRGL